MDLSTFAADVGIDGPVRIAGHGSRVPGCDLTRTVRAPSGIDWFEPAEMTVCCGAGTPVSELASALADHDQTVAITPVGTVGGALAVGYSGLRRLGRGALRDTLLQARYVSATSMVIKAGGPTVKNVSGFDLCRLLVGSFGTLGFLGEVIMRTRPRPEVSKWYAGPAEPIRIQTTVYRPASILWDGITVWVCLEGDQRDVDAQAAALGFELVDGPPPLPEYRWSLPPTELGALTGRFVAEIGVGTVHRETPPPRPAVAPAVVEIHRRLKAEFDPTGRLNPGLDPLCPPAVRESV